MDRECRKQGAAGWQKARPYSIPVRHLHGRHTRISMASRFVRFQPRARARARCVATCVRTSASGWVTFVPTANRLGCAFLAFFFLPKPKDDASRRPNRRIAGKMNHGHRGSIPLSVNKYLESYEALSK
jgi:hypothetical protein